MPVPDRPFYRATHSSKGAALLIFMLLLVLASASLLISSSNTSSPHNDSDRITAAALALAKDALIGRASSDSNRPGSLPCPDMDNDGVAEMLVGNLCPVYVGRLPWKTLRLPELLDGSGHTLWYALSPGLTDTGASHPINTNKPLELTLNATLNIAAIVFSPGRPLTNQNSRPSNNAYDYLDGNNSDGDYNYVALPHSSSFNDTTLAISREELFRTVCMRILGEIRGPDDNSPNLPASGLRQFFQANGIFPWADSSGDGIADPGSTSGRLPFNELSFDAATKNWMTLNNWFDLVNYQRTSVDSVSISIGATVMPVVPCPLSPCP